MKEWKKILHVNGKSKRTKVAVLISGKIDVKSKRATKNKEGHYRTRKVLSSGRLSNHNTRVVSNTAPE